MKEQLPRLCNRCAENSKDRSKSKRKYRKEFPVNPLTGNDLLNVLRCRVCCKCLVTGNSQITGEQMKRLQMEDYYRLLGKPNKRITERMLGKSFRKLVERRRREITPYPVCGSYQPDYERYPDERLGWCEADFLPEYPQDIPEDEQMFPAGGVGILSGCIV